MSSEELNANPPATPSPNSQESSPPPARDSPLRLLLVEDNPDDALLVERVLRRAGFLLNAVCVETAADMSAALARSELPDLIIADYNLPRFSGPAALRLLSATGLDIPFIMTSGAISEETAVESMRAGAKDYVTKQNLARLVPVVDRELRDAASRRRERNAEQALHASEERFRRLIQAMPIGLLIADTAGRLSYSNNAAQFLLGTVDDGVALTSLLPEWNVLLAAAEAVGAAAPPSETIGITTDGQTIDVLVGLTHLNPESSASESSAPGLSRDDDRQIAAFLVDLTLQKKSAEVLRRTEKLAVAGRFAASIAHEINNPLEAVTNCLYLVSQTALPAEARTYLDLAQSELNRVAQITVQTLRFYRRSTQATQTDVHDLLENVLSLMDSRLRRCATTVRRQYGKIEPVVIHDGEIRQVLANLIGNAIDALGTDGTLIVRTAPTRDWRTGQPGLRITVADNGAGMSTLR